MIAVLLGGISASPFGRAALRYGAVALAILLFLLSIRRSGERTGRIAERLKNTEKTNDVQRRMLEAAARRPRDRGELVDRLRDGGF
jgi:hypothetical protein